MPSQIRPNRLEVSDRFPMLGFTIRTDGESKRFEVVIATDTALFRPEARSRRSKSNFFSSRAGGLLPIEKGEAVYVLPTEILARFAGQEKLYFAMATYSNGRISSPELSPLPSEGSAYINLKGFSGRSLKRVRLLPSRQQPAQGYGTADTPELEWAGDAAMPGTQPVAAAPAAPPTASPVPGKSNGAVQASPETGGQPAAGSAQAAALLYNDGWGPLPIAEPQAIEDEGESRSIEEPIPDGESACTEQQACSTALESSEYPQASRFVPAASNNYRSMSTPRTISRIVIHITDGGPSIAGTLRWFQNPDQRNRSGKHITVSTHYVVGQDGEVVQMVRHNDVAWHANTANSDSIGIDACARQPRAFGKNDPGLYPAEAQYCAMAALVQWLCTNLGIPIDRTHILGHAEADTRTSHRACPNSVWDWDYFMGLVKSSSCYPREPVAQGAALGSSRVFNPRHSLAMSGQLNDLIWDDVRLVPETSGASCWASALAMIIGWRDRTTVDSAAVENRAPATDRRSLAGAWDLVAEPAASYNVIEMNQMLGDHGPLWAAARTQNDPHAFVIAGMCGDGTPDGTSVTIKDPWGQTGGSPAAPKMNPTPGKGSEYTLTYRELAAQYDPRGLSNAPDATHADLQLIYVRSIEGRRPARITCDAVPAQSLAMRYSGAARSRATGESTARAFDAPPLEPGDVVKVGSKKYVIYENEVRSGGVYAWINNNPGNITKGKWAEDHGALAGKSNGGFAIFPDEYTGFNAIISFIERYPNDTIYNLMARYAPPDDGKNPMLKGNDPEAYANSIARKLSVPVTTRIKDLSDEKKLIYAEEIQRIETGAKGEGTIYSYTDQALPEEIRSRLPVRQPDSSSDGESTAESLALGRGFAGALSISAFGGTGVDKMRAEFVANKASGAARRNCITIANDGLRKLYGDSLLNDDGSQKALGSTIQGTMAALQGYGLADTSQVFEFLDASGKLTKGVVRPDCLRESVEAWLLAQAESNQMSAWYCFGLSLMDGYHSVVLALAFSGTGNASTKLYWADQIYSGWDDITGKLDGRITSLIQRWWDPLPANRKARTRVTVWPLIP